MNLFGSFVLQGVDFFNPSIWRNGKTNIDDKTNVDEKSSAVYRPSSTFLYLRQYQQCQKPYDPLESN